jgi:hypothetical protein
LTGKIRDFDGWRIQLRESLARRPNERGSPGL